MLSDWGALLRDAIILAYMFILRIGVPLLITILLGKYIQRKLEERDLAERRMLHGEPYCWERRETPQTRRAKWAAVAHPDLPCWLALQVSGEGLLEGCYTCPRFTIRQPSRGSVYSNVNAHG